MKLTRLKVYSLPVLVLAAGLAAVVPAAAQTAGSTGVGGASQRSGFPAGGNAVVLPSIGGSSTTTTSTGTTGTTTSTTTGTTGTSTTGNTTSGTGTGTGTGTTATGAGGGAASASRSTTSGRSSGTGRGGGTGTGTGSSAGAVSSGSNNWVLCPPPGATGFAPFLEGTDLSCAP